MLLTVHAPCIFGLMEAQHHISAENTYPKTCWIQHVLGFTHICGTNRTTGYFIIIRTTISKRMAAKLKQIQAELRRRMHDSLAETTKWLQSVVRGYFQYHAVPGNEKRLEAFRAAVLRLWLRQIRRRSQRSRWTWERFLERFEALLPEVCILHPYPTPRFDARHPR